VHVLHIVASGTRRGAEVFASDLVRTLDLSGVAQTVAVLRGTGHMVTYDAPVVSLARNGHALPGIGMDPRAVMRLRELVRGSVPDVVQAHGGEALKYAVASTFGLRVPVVYRRIGPTTDRTAHGLRNAAYAALMSRARRVVAVAEALRGELIEVFHVPADRVVTIPNGVDPARLVPTTDRARVRRSLGIPRDAPVALFLGALTWEKDPMVMVEVAGHVMVSQPNARVLVVGDGPLNRPVEAAIRERLLSDRVHMLGSRADVADLLATSDVLLFTSRSEGMPASVIEAAMLGIPTASFSVGGVPEVVEHGATGLLAAPGERSRLAAHVVRLLEDVELRRHMGRAARERSLARFDVHVIAPRYLALYEELVA